MQARMIAFLLKKQMAITARDDEMTSVRDLYAVQMHGNNLDRFQNDWDGAIQRIPPDEVPRDSHLEYMYFSHIEHVP